MPITRPSEVNRIRSADRDSTGYRPLHGSDVHNYIVNRSSAEPCNNTSFFRFHLLHLRYPAPLSMPFPECCCTLGRDRIHTPSSAPDTFSFTPHHPYFYT